MIEEEQAIELAAAAMGVRPLRAVREPLSKSGKAVFRIELPNQQTVALRTSDRPRTFAFTQRNFHVLRELGLPVPMVLAQGPTADGGSFIILNWIPGRDLVHELGSMSRTQITRLAEQMVELQQRVAGLPESTGFGWAPIGRNGPLQEWTQVFGETAPAAAVDEDTIMGRFRGRLRRVRSGLEPYFRTVRPRCFLDDLTLKNALVHDGALSGVIDVDFACYGDPLLAIGAHTGLHRRGRRRAGKFLWRGADPVLESRPPAAAGHLVLRVAVGNRVSEYDRRQRRACTGRIALVRHGMLAAPRKPI